MRWTALVPLRLGPVGKTRLGSALSNAERSVAVARMARHVLAILAQCPQIDERVVLTDRVPDMGETRCAEDRGRGLNREIAAFRDGFGPGPLLVVHADLPLVGVADVDSLLDTAERYGAALATDRAGTGTNALALADGRDFGFEFGPNSRALHCAQDADMPVVRSIGLAADLDTPSDLEFLRERGFDTRSPQDSG